MAAPKSHPSEYREALERLVIKQGTTIAEACRLLAAGYQELEPRNIPEGTAGEWVANARRIPSPSLEGMELPTILDTTARGLFDLVNTGIYRMKQGNSRPDPEELLTYAKTLKELQPLTSQKPKGSKGNEEDNTLLGTLGNGGNTSDRANLAEVPTDPVTTHVAPGLRSA